MKRPNWFGRMFLRAAGIPVKTAVSMADERYWSTWSPQGGTTPTGLSDMSKAVGDGTTLDVIMTPVLWIARRMAESPIGVVELADDAVLDLEHDIAVLLKWPTPWYAGSTMRLAMAINYLMDGNIYLRKYRDTRGKVVATVFIPSWAIEPLVPTGAGYIDQYRYTLGGESQPANIPAKDIIHIRFGIDPNNTRKGISPLKVLLRELYTDMQGAVMTATLMKNAGIMGVVLSPMTGSIMDPAKPTETKKYIEDEFTGARMGKPMVMTTPTKVDYLGVDAAKMDLSRLREIPEERVCALLNVPAAVVGFGTGMQQTKVGATLIELRAMAYEDCIIPIQNGWCDEFDLQLMPDFEEEPRKFHCQFDNSRVRVLQDDENAISEKLMRQLSAGAITLGECREQIGQEADDSHNVFYIPMGTMVIPADEIDTPTPPPAPTPPADSSASSAEEDTAQAESSPKGMKQGLHGAARMTPKLARLTRKLIRQERAARKAWEPLLADALRAYAAKVAERFDAVATRREAKAAVPDWEAIIDEAALISAANRDSAVVAESYSAQFIKVAKLTFEALDAELDLGVMLTDDVQTMIIRAGGRRLGLLDLDRETRNSMFEILAQAREEGLGADAMANLIREQVGAGPWRTADTRAQVIARTETKYAQNYSSLEAYRESDTVSDVLIFDAQLGPTDEECEARNGTTVSLEEAIRMMETSHPNCTLSFAPVVT